MRRKDRIRISLIGAALVLTAASLGNPARADYTMDLLSIGGHSREILPGQSFPLDIVLTSDADDHHNSAIYQLRFCIGTTPAPGLRYDSYLWSAPYETGETGTIWWDDSKPILSDLPVTLDATTLSGPGYTPGVVDIELSNVVPTGQGLFGQGVLTTLTFTVPADFAPDRMIWITAMPDTIANGFNEIPTTAGPNFELHIVPEPTGAVLLLVVGMVLQKRRLSRTAEATREAEQRELLPRS